MNRLSGPRKTANLSESIHQLIDMYAIAASGAGMGVLALAQPAAAKIIYTHAHVVIGHNHSYLLDFNHDGTTDFTIKNLYNHQGTCSYRNEFYEVPKIGNEVEGKPIPAALVQGSRIGHTQSFQGTRGTMAAWVAFHRNGQCVHFNGGHWLNGDTRYLGVAFQIHGKTHYGWARFSVSRSAATLTGYAYETIAGKSIIAGRTKGTADESGEEGLDTATSLTNPIPTFTDRARRNRWFTGYCFGALHNPITNELPTTWFLIPTGASGETSYKPTSGQLRAHIRTASLQRTGVRLTKGSRSCPLFCTSSRVS